MKKVTCKGLTMKETRKGFEVSNGTNTKVFEKFEDATDWLCGGAGEVENEMAHKICKNWNRNIYGGLNNTDYSEEESIKLIKEDYEISLELAKRVLFENLTLEYDEDSMKYKIYDEKGNLKEQVPVC